MSTVIDYKPGTVMHNFNKRSAIVTAVGTKLIYFVAMDDGELTVRSTDMRLMEYDTPLDYPLKRAVRIYLHHSGGVSSKARSALKALLSST